MGLFAQLPKEEIHVRATNYASYLQRACHEHLKKTPYYNGHIIRLTGLKAKMMPTKFLYTTFACYWKLSFFDGPFTYKPVTHVY